MIKKILVAYDGGEQARKALEAAVEIAKKSEGEIILASAYAIPIVYQSTLSLDGIYPDNSAVIDYLYKTTHAHLEKILAEAAELVKSHDIPVKIQILDGSPGRILVQLAETEGCDLIAIGSHNRTAVDRFFMGSVANYVVQHAHNLVLVAKSD